MGTLLIETRRAEPRDAFGISAVHDAAWRHAYTGLIPHRSLDTMVRRRDAKWWARAIRHSTRIIVMECHGKIVGYATLGANRVSAIPHQGEVYELYLLPEYQGIGLGRKLFLAAREEVAVLGLRGCVVWVLSDNSPAVQFYRNAGGRDVAEGSETFNGNRLAKLAFAWD